ncbi:hypothetical protein [Streptomyces sp. JJ66]|uniref:hypothetical protein n=1 Tax=Streptomyces sp. JJ66 TaxID=2803843 RepID=UPI0027E29B51|nr:hypothetical protein [Streptomyces sp. JJ66]
MNAQPDEQQRTGRGARTGRAVWTGQDAWTGRGARTVRAARAVRLGAGALALVAAVAGCGIRATPVPVDAGPAPSRVACGVRETGASPRPGTREVRVSLVCSGRVVDVRRAVELPSGDSQADRLTLARTLLDQLRQPPVERERAAGFTTAVPDDLRVTGPADPDDPEALRLSRPPAALPSSALAQLVCTYADTSLADRAGGVLLGGPAPDPDATPSPDGAEADDAEAGDTSAGDAGADGTQVRRYECDVALRTSADGDGSAERATLTP